MYKPNIHVPRWELQPSEDNMRRTFGDHSHLQNQRRDPSGASEKCHSVFIFYSGRAASHDPCSHSSLSSVEKEAPWSNRPIEAREVNVGRRDLRVYWGLKQ